MQTMPPHKVGQIISLLRSALEKKMKARMLPKKQQKPIEWGGPTFTELAITKSSSAPVSETLSDDGLAYHAERDRDPLDVILMLAFQFGMENGIASEQDVSRFLERDNERMRAKLGEKPMKDLTLDDIDFSFLSEDKE